MASVLDESQLKQTIFEFTSKHIKQFEGHELQILF